MTRAGTARMLWAGTTRDRPIDGRTDPSFDLAAVPELAVICGIESVECIARADLMAATGEKVYPARLRLAAIRGLLRALTADMRAGSHHRAQELVDRLDRLDDSTTPEEGA